MYSRGICRAREGSKDRELPVLDRYRTEGENAFMMEQSLPECGLDEGLRSVVLMNGGGRIQCHSTRRWAFMRIPIEHPAQRSAAQKMCKKNTRDGIKEDAVRKQASTASLHNMNARA